MTAPSPRPDWLTPADLAKQMDAPERWVKDQMAAGVIPSIKVGRRRYFTPECRERMVDAALGEKPRQTAAQSWDRATRTAS